MEYKKKLAIFIHVYYIDIFVKEILPFLKKIPTDIYDLYITTSHQEKLVYISCKELNPRIYTFENKGRDVLPFLKIVKNIGKDYDKFLKIHTKNLNPVEKKEYEFKKIWKENFFEKLLDKNIVKKVFDEDISFLGVIDTVLSFERYIGGNYLLVKKYLDYLGVVYCQEMEFFAGTMFYGKIQNIEPLLFLIDEYWDDDLTKDDGTMAHAVERLFLSCCLGLKKEIFKDAFFLYSRP